MRLREKEAHLKAIDDYNDAKYTKNQVYPALPASVLRSRDGGAGYTVASFDKEINTGIFHVIQHKADKPAQN